MITRSLKFSLNEANSGKLKKLAELEQEYFRVVNLFIDHIFDRRGTETEPLTEKYIREVESKLSSPFRQAAKRQAFKMYKSWCRRLKGKKKKKAEHPKLKGGVQLNQNLFLLKKADKTKEFDFWINISSLEKGKRVRVPIKSYKYANKKYFDDPNWELCKSAKLFKEDEKWFVQLTFRMKTKPKKKKKKKGKKVGVDIGYRKLFVTSSKQIIGNELPSLINEATRKQQGSKAEKRKRAQIRCFVNRCCKLLFEQNKEASEIVLEDLKNLKKNKKGKWNRSVNRKFGYWFYKQALSRLNQLSEINDVHIHLIDPKYTSQECPFCGTIDSSNKRNEVFECCHCGSAKQDADFVGALNILFRQFGRELKVPDITKTQRLQVVPVDQ